MSSREDQGNKSFRLHIEEAVKKESRKCEECCLWLDRHMPPSFFEEMSEDDILLIAHNLMGFDLHNYFATIHLKQRAIALCLDSNDADLKILKQFQNFGIKNYRTFVSNAPPPFPGITSPLRIALIFFTQISEKELKEESFPEEKKEEIFSLIKERHPDLSHEEFSTLMSGLGVRFLRGMTQERLIAALDMFFRAKTRDHCQYEVRYNEDWKAKEIPSMQIVFAWRNVPKHHFLYKLAKTIYRHGLIMKRVNATYINPYSKDSILLMSIALHGGKGKAAWEEADIDDFLKELVTLKYFEGLESIDSVFVDSGVVRGNLGNLIKSITHFIHQTLVHADLNMYSLANITEGICRHPELIVQLTQAFEYKFHPKNHEPAQFEKLKESYLASVADLDTGNEINDTRRRNILRQAMNFVDHLLKTDFYRNNKTAFSFRLDPDYLNFLPYDRSDKFPALPFAIFFMHGMYYIGFHIRFKDLARGGLRTVFTQKFEQMLSESNNVFSECYNLAYTQQKKNKDIPEGGAKAVIFLEPYERLHYEADIYKKELEEALVPSGEIETRLKNFNSAQKLEFLYHAQRTYIESFLTLINCEPDGTLKAKNIVDYWKKPEYIYLGPDENLHNVMIEWIANYSKAEHYKPGGSFITSKPGAGINHKEYGVTSYGVNVCMEEVLKYLKIDPYKDPFTIKISGGPDGDVAGNQILNLYKFFPQTAKLLAITDVSGTIYDPKGLDLSILAQMFKEEKAIRFYPPEKLNDGGFLLDLFTKKELTAYAQQTLCWRKKGNKAVEDWLSGNEMNHLFRHNLHQTPADVFIPGGGRPRTLNENNYQDFLDDKGKPTSKAIVEGANLYLTPFARRKLEELGVLIIKDSSANKGGVICSSFEVLCGLTLTEEEFRKEKTALMPEILNLIGEKAQNEAKLLLSTHAKTGAYLTDISEKISQKINGYKYELLDFLIPKTLSLDPKDPLIRCLLRYCPPLLSAKYQDRILKEIPDVHKKAIIATYIASRIVYHRGIEWAPSIADILPLIATDPLFH
ncbi:MAG TPA: NAD-glutamate dehydrogenase domain-containing protein [Rhabdochlamydiaceae bacterium]|nr:NAD-glutamate dehydrogenase domain-containing protein [Rhabdochlamydiaceae bacterium]